LHFEIPFIFEQNKTVVAVKMPKFGSYLEVSLFCFFMKKTLGRPNYKTEYFEMKDLD